MIPAPGSVRGLFFCPSGCLIGCNSRQARRNRPVPHNCPRHSPAPVLRRSEGSQGHARVAHNVPGMRCKARKGLVARFVCIRVLTTKTQQKRVTRCLQSSQRHSPHILRVSPPVFCPDPPGSQPQNAAEPPEPQRIFAQDSSGFSVVFLFGFSPVFYRDFRQVI
jgi:hypothetical protein